VNQTNRLFTYFFFSAILLGLPCGVLAQDWEILKTDNFTVLGDTGDTHLRKTAEELELFRRVLASLFPNASFVHQLPVRVVIFKSQRSFRPFWPQHDGKPRIVGGYFLEGTPAYIAICTETPESRKRTVTGKRILHEYVHYFLENNFAYVPVWIHEGLAQYYSTFKVRDQGEKIQIGSPLTRPMETLRMEPLLPLKALFSVEFNSADYNEGRRTPLFYAQTWALVHLLLMSPEYSPGFSGFVTALDLGAPVESAFQKHFGKSLEETEKELDQYVHAFSLPVRNYEFPESIQKEEHLEVSTLGEHEIEFYKGELHYRLGKRKEAEEHYLRSIDLDNDFAEALVRLAEMRIEAGQLDGSMQLLERARKSPPESFNRAMVQGSLWETLERDEKALESYELATSLLPESALPYQRIGLIHLARGDDQAAEKAFLEARVLNPNDLSIHLNRAFVFLARQQGEKAATEAAIFVRRRRRHDTSAAYGLLLLYFGKLQQAGLETAQKSLLVNQEWQSPRDWPLPVFQFLKGEIDAEDLVAAAADDDQLTEAHTYLGLSLLYTGKESEALNHLEWVVEMGNKWFLEYQVAKAALERLRADS
jgi:tetratricopeptide (TPR) repeat protein